MELIYKGKTKNVFKLDNGNYLLKFKDDVTGENGIFDPGANTIGLTIDGIGKKGLMMTTYYFNLLTKNGIYNHFVESNINESSMVVKPAKVFKKGLEVICRLKATGSFMKRYGDYIEEGSNLNYFTEITLKDDERGDPVISVDALTRLNILSKEQYDIIINRTVEISKIIENDLKEKNIILYDIKLEFGLDLDNNIMLIDEISGGNMRAYKDDKILDPETLVSLIVNK